MTYALEVGQKIQKTVEEEEGITFVEVGPAVRHCSFRIVFGSRFIIVIPRRYVFPLYLHMTYKIIIQNVIIRITYTACNP
jgi:hypothetical protein